MGRPPRTPREIKRATEPTDDAIAGPELVRRVDPRQADLFEVTFIEPCKPKLAAKAPEGDLWQYEIKHDGYRAQCHVLEGRVRIYTKNGHDWTDRFPGIVAGLLALTTVRSAVLDGEAVIEGDDMISDFWALHQAVARRKTGPAIIYAFDLLHLDGKDLRPPPLGERRAILAEITLGAPPGIELSPHHVGDGEAMHRHVCRMGMEGIVAKRRDAPYRSGYVDSWLKIKCTQTDSFAVIGHEPAGRSGVRALKLARLVDGELTPCGWVGSGITEAAGKAIRAALDAGQPVVMDVEYRGWTPSGELRHAVVKGWHGG